MIELEKLQVHLNSLQLKDWQRLFNLLPEIESTKSFNESIPEERPDENIATFPFLSPSKIVEDTLRVIVDLDIMPAFDWPGWAYGKTLINDKETDYNKKNTVTLCKLLTTIVRADKFNEGFLVSCFDSGLMAKIIRALELNVKKHDLAP